MYTSISRVCCVNMHDCAGEKSAGNGSTWFVERFWKYIASLSLSLLSPHIRVDHPFLFFFFLTFCLASLAFRPIPTYFSHSHSISYRSHPLSLILPLSPATLSLHSTRPRIALLAALLELSRESRQERAECNYSCTREGRRSLFCAEICAVVRNERVSRKISLRFPRVCARYPHTYPRVILVCDKPLGDCRKINYTTVSAMFRFSFFLHFFFFFYTVHIFSSL